MYQISVHSAIAVLEGVDVDEAERQHRGGQHRVELARCPAVEGDQAVDELLQIFRPGTHVAGDRLLSLAVPFADKAALGAQTERYEAIVADHDALQAAQFFDIQRLFARLPMAWPQRWMRA